MNLSKKEREALRMMFGGRCAYCGIELTGKWHADHVEAVLRKLKNAGDCYRPQNDRKDNLFPACAPCNIDKGAMGLEEWREYLHYRIVERLRVNSSTFRHAERFGVVSIDPSPLVFCFEKYRNSQEAA